MLNQKIDELLEMPYYVVDILSRQVEGNSEGQYFNIEEYYLQKNNIEKLYTDFADLLLKLNCYYDFAVSCNYADKWEINPSPQLFVDWILRCAKEETYMNIIIEKENVMFIVNGSFTHFTVYNPSLKIRHLIAELAGSKGLFLRKSQSEDIHDLIVRELTENKSVSAFIWLIEKGRELEFNYQDKKCFVSKSSSISTVSLWVDNSEQAFTSAEQLWEGAEIENLKLQHIWEQISIITLF